MGERFDEDLPRAPQSFERAITSSAAKVDLIRVAAVPGLPIHELRLASPELALVDATLAAELRLGLSLPVDVVPAPRGVFSDVCVALQAPEKLVETILDDRVGTPGSDAGDVDNEEIVDVLDDHVPDTPSESSLRPALPAPEPGEQDAFEATDAALRQIRENFKVEPRKAPRRFRKGFTAAAGASAVCASLVLAADVQLGVVQLPAWLHFWS